MMNKLGVCSITFRDLSCEQLIDLVVECDLDAIEWGADLHVKPGDLSRAHEVKALMDDNNLMTSSYGSYYRVGIDNEYSFEEVLKSAEALGAKDIRVWAGRLGSQDADAEYFNNVVSDSKRIATLAQARGIRVNYEYHGKTLTDTPESAMRLLEAVDHKNMKLYWQPAVDVKAEQRVQDIQYVSEYITNVHVFSWVGIERQYLEEQYDNWKSYIETINNNASKELRYYLIEFTKDDSIESFRKDAKALKLLLK